MKIEWDEFCDKANDAPYKELINIYDALIHQSCLITALFISGIVNAVALMSLCFVIYFK